MRSVKGVLNNPAWGFVDFLYPPSYRRQRTTPCRNKFCSWVGPMRSRSVSLWSMELIPVTRTYLWKCRVSWSERWVDICSFCTRKTTTREDKSTGGYGFSLGEFRTRPQHSGQTRSIYFQIRSFYFANPECFQLCSWEIKILFGVNMVFDEPLLVVVFDSSFPFLSRLLPPRAVSRHFNITIEYHLPFFTTHETCHVLFLRIFVPHPLTSTFDSFIPDHSPVITSTTPT